MVLCTSCGSPLTDSADRCGTCNADAGAPNVRKSKTAEEQEALQLRYKEAKLRARSAAHRAAIELLELTAATTVPSINVRLPFLRQFVVEGKELYASYHAGVTAETRRAAPEPNDRERAIVDATLFGSYMSSVRFAALMPLGGRGLIGYGEYAMILRDVTVKDRATVLEENGFDFVEHHQITPKKPVPPGYRAVWSQRGILAVAKLADDVPDMPSADDLSRLILTASDDRKQDRFMEVHIYGPFDAAAVESVVGKKPVSKVDRAIWQAVKDHLGNLKKRVEEW